METENNFEIQRAIKRARLLTIQTSIASVVIAFVIVVVLFIILVTTRFSPTNPAGGLPFQLIAFGVISIVVIIIALLHIIISASLSAFLKRNRNNISKFSSLTPWIVFLSITNPIFIFRGITILHDLSDLTSTTVTAEKDVKTTGSSKTIKTKGKNTSSTPTHLTESDIDKQLRILRKQKRLLKLQQEVKPNNKNHNEKKS